ncbi:MAG: hypothetical protein ACRDVM_04355, partial [Acidimicrobiia bacterium]
MVGRLGWIAGFGSLALGLLRLRQLLRPGEGGLSWELVVVAAALLGAVVTWAADAYRLPSWLTLALNGAGIGLTLLRVAVSDSLALGIVPTGDTWAGAGRELGFALEVIRFGSAPVIPAAGLVAILAGVFWGLSSLVAWGLLVGRPVAGLAPPFFFYLQLATIDRRPIHPVWTAALLIAVAASLMAWAAVDHPAGSGRLRRPDGRPLRGA